MKQAIIVLLCLNLWVLIIQSVDAIGKLPQYDSTSVEGDMNGDREIDITDPVYLLEFLFLDGPAPVAFAGPATEIENRVTHIEDMFEGFHREGITLVFEGTLETELNPCIRDNSDGSLNCLRLFPPVHGTADSHIGRIWDKLNSLQRQVNELK